ncbi:VWA domain-containing protein [Paracoccus sulfuroxidans]|uniref:Ca-activated chloride channel family protein n=1 Tax=Paracoccus sulfuroxidans TaxID=384678 RepID=A0A562NG18_9RHOB|nr:VWA domain-containing protein [Paracoccus sulfuroxidans]TWI31033.1 Ca-activated chloride channel family protein [Paracoccus sulfuroxidans]
MILLRPLWLILLPLVLALAIVLWRRGPDSGGWQSVLPPQMRAGLVALGWLGKGDGVARFLPLAGATVLALALAGPAIPRPDAPVFAQSDAVVIAIDMSPSVTQGTALADAQAAAAGLLGQLAGRPVGLILYAGEAYAVAAPTSDPATLESQISVLDAETMPDTGSRPAAAMALAGQMLAGSSRADLVLVTDGGGMDKTAEVEAQRLASAGVRVSALTITGSPATDVSTLPGMLNGAVAPASAPGPVQRALAASGLDPDPAMIALQYRDLGPWLAALALLPLAMRFRRQA